MTESECPDHPKSLLESLFRLSPGDVEIYEAMARLDGISVRDAGHLVGRERSTAYRALTRLNAFGIVRKDTESIPGGGYLHVYRAVEPEMLVESIRENLGGWFARVSDFLDVIVREEKTLEGLTTPVENLEIFTPSEGDRIGKRAEGGLERKIRDRGTPKGERKRSEVPEKREKGRGKERDGDEAGEDGDDDGDYDDDEGQDEERGGRGYRIPIHLL